MILKYLVLVGTIFSFGGCALNDAKQSSERLGPESTPPGPRSAADAQRISELERSLAERQRQCLVDKRRLELALKESQKQAEETQKKLDALLAIDRELRARGKAH